MGSEGGVLPELEAGLGHCPGGKTLSFAAWAAPWVRAPRTHYKRLGHGTG